MYTYKVRPAFGDIDGLRHVNNTRLPYWFELAREPIFERFNPDLKLDNWNLIMARIEVDFLAQMVLGYEIEIRTVVEHIGNSSFTVGHEAWQRDVLGAKGKAVVVYFDFEANRAVRIPDDRRRELEEHLVMKAPEATGQTGN